MHIFYLLLCCITIHVSNQAMVPHSPHNARYKKLSALAVAVINQDLGLVKVLVSAGANIDEELLNIAVESDNGAREKIIGAHKTISRESLSERDSLKIIKLLIDKGANTQLTSSIDENNIELKQIFKELPK